MYGAILGDMIGAPFEFDRGNKSKDFQIFSSGTHFTDDTVMTVAVAEALMETEGKTPDEIKAALVRSMQKWGARYPHAGYGGMFRRWLRMKDPQPYGSFGNGSAMRVSAVGWLYDSLEETRRIARLTAEVTHNHPEGIKGAEAAASAIFLARCGKPKDEIRDYIVQEFRYDLSRTCDEIRPYYHHVETCQGTVPEAVTAFLEGTDFEDVIRTAVSLGGDCDTLTCIAGGVGEAFYGVPEDMIRECRKRLPEDMLTVLDAFKEKISGGSESFQNPFLDGNEVIEQAISDFHAEGSRENLFAVLYVIRTRMHADGHWLFPVEMEEDGRGFTFRAIQADDGKLWPVAFTSQEEYEKGEPSELISNFIDSTLRMGLEMDFPGWIINPWGQSFMLAEELIRRILEAEG